MHDQELHNQVNIEKITEISKEADYQPYNLSWWQEKTATKAPGHKESPRDTFIELQFFD